MQYAAIFVHENWPVWRLEPRMPRWSTMVRSHQGTSVCVVAVMLTSACIRVHEPADGSVQPRDTTSCTQALPIDLLIVMQSAGDVNGLVGRLRTGLGALLEPLHSDP